MEIEGSFGTLKMLPVEEKSHITEFTYGKNLTQYPHKRWPGPKKNFQLSKIPVKGGSS